MISPAAFSTSALYAGISPMLASNRTTRSRGESYRSSTSCVAGPDPLSTTTTS